MNQLKWTLLPVLLFAFSASLGAQAFSKQWIFEQGQSVLQRKLKASPDELMEMRRQAQADADAVEHPPVSFRSAENNLSGSEEPESEVHAAINPRDTNNIIVAAMELDAGQLLSSLSFPIYYTKDFGQSWQRSAFDGVSDLPVLTFILGGGDPVLAFDTDGTAYLSWLTFTGDLSLTIGIQLHWATSTDGGATWERQPGYIDAGTVVDLENPQSRFVDKQWMATDLSESAYRNNLYTAYVEINLNDTTYNILVRTKTAEGESFGEPVDVTPEEMAFSQFSSLDVDSDGTVHVMFAGARLQDQTLSLYHTSSQDGGQSFSDPVRISSLHLPCFPPGAGGPCDLVGVDSARVYPCPHLRVDRSGGPTDGRLYAVWTADGFTTELTEGVDIYYSYSKDGGANWTEPIVLNNDRIPESEQFFPSLSVNEDGILAISWYDRREDPNNLTTKYYMTYSTDGGLSFAEDFPVSTQGADFSKIGAANGNFGVGEYTQIVTTRGYAIPVWADGRSNDGNIDIFVAFLPLGESVTSLPEIGVVSDRFSLGLPIPNPAQGTTRAELQLQAPSPVEVHLFDAQGRLAGKKDFGQLGAGTHLLDISLEGIPAGNYLMRANTGFGYQSRKLTVAE